MFGITEGAEDLQPHASFGRRLAIAFSAVAVLTVLLAAILISAVWNYQFDQYLKDNLQRIADGVSALVETTYPLHGGWTLNTLSTIPSFASMRGVAVQILDGNGTLIYDDTSNYESTTSSSMSTQPVSFSPEGPVLTSPIVVNGTRVGTVRVWAYGPGAVATERDAKFKAGSLTALTLAALFAVAIASISGLLYSKRMVRPIAEMTSTVQAMKQGDTSARTGFEGDDEISALGRAFDEMADAIEADREMERRLTADVAHELRTPLMGIQATVEAMQDGVMPADSEHLAIVRNETVRLGRLTEAILELTRLERGSLPFDLRPIDLSHPIQAAVDSMHALMDACELKLVVDITPGVSVVGDADRLQQAASNLLSNAARYTEPGGTILCRVFTQGRVAVIEVSDTGIGIAPENLSHVFGRFWRADEARATSTGGLGVGLAVTKEIVERHRGRISVESVLGEGTTFRIVLPLAQTQAT